MPGVMEERKNVPFTLVKRKTDESLERILCSLLKTQNIHGKDGKSTCKPFLLCGMLILWKLLLPSETGRARAEHSRERMGLVAQTTKRALEASLKKLLVQKPLNKITINDITEDCGVNRMTFYYHFKDIYDLVDWILTEDAVKAMEGRQSFDTWTEAFLEILHQIRDNKTLVLNVYRSVGREQVEQYLYKLLDPMLKEFADRECRDITVQDDDKQFVVDFYKYALVGVVLEWIRRDMKTEPAVMVERMGRMLQGDLRRALCRLASNKIHLEQDG